MSPNDLIIGVESPSSSRAVVVLEGEIDLATAPQLRSFLDEKISAGITEVVIDAQEVSFVDSTGIAVFAFAKAELEARGGRLRVIHPSSSLRKVLDLTGFSGLIDEGE
jgi:anti-sigma B factor antagonist